MYDLPTKIELNEHHLTIRNRGDFRVVLDCFEALNDTDISRQERIFACLIIFYADLSEIEDIYTVIGEEHIEEATTKMFDFFNCNQELVESQKSKRKLVSWVKDEQMIIAGINKVAGKEVRAEEYMHWFTFMSFYISIGESLLSTVISIRDKIARGKKLEKYEKEFQRENPSYFSWDFRSNEEIEAENEIMRMWNNGGK